MEKLRSFCEDIIDSMNGDMSHVVSDFGEQGDAQPIIDSVERLMGIYKRALLWKQSFSLIDTQEDYKTPMEKFFLQISNTVFEIFDTLYRKSRKGMALVNECLDGKIAEKELHLDLTVEFRIDYKYFTEIFHKLVRGLSQDSLASLAR